jgi:signal transduction histidine kinase
VDDFPARAPQEAPPPDRPARLRLRGGRRVSWRRLLALGLLIACTAGVAGAAIEWWRFGPTTESAAARAEVHVRRTFDRMTASLEGVASSLAGDPAVTTTLAAGPDSAAALFDAIARRVGEAPARADDVAVTIYDADHIRPRAWIGRASDTFLDRVPGPEGSFVTPSPLGLRLVHLRPVVIDGRRLGVIAAEHVLSASHAAAAITAAEYTLDTPFGPAALRLRWEGAGDRPRPYTFLLRDAAGDPLIEVALSPADLDAARGAWRRRVTAVVVGLVALTLVLLFGPLLDARTAVPDARAVVRLTAAGIGLVAGAAALAWAAARIGAGHRLLPEASLLIAGVAAAGAVALLASPLGRLRLALRARPVRFPADTLGFVATHLAAGLLLAGAIVGLQAVVGWAVDPDTADLRHFSLYPWSGPRLLLLCGLVAWHAAALWGATLALVAALARWRTARSGTSLRGLAAALWLAPAVGVVLVAGVAGWTLPAGALLGAAVACAAAALVSERVVAWYRKATVAARILATYVAFLVPALLLYPSVEFYVDRAMREVVATRYAADAQEHPQQLQAHLEQALAEIDALPGLHELAEADQTTRGAGTDAAFFIWRQTVLARARLTSAVELYDPGDAPVSRFALNFPEYAGAEPAPLLESSCSWEVYGEAAPSLSGERGMLHAQRHLCHATPSGATEAAGTIVVHVVPDYRTLPFITSQSPYFEVFRQQDGRQPRETPVARDVEAVIYGWGLGPIFTSGRAAWPIGDELFARIYGSREPLWTTLDLGGARYHVHFANDRAGIYAVGYRAPSLFDDLVHLAELTTLSGALFLAVLLATAAFTRVARERPRVGRELLREIRASFHRKLFLAFVLASILPVLTLALVIRGYFANLLRVDIEAEATRIAAVAQRVIEESDALVPDGVAPLSDDVMVWISQVIDHDVNIFDGPHLVATSERDLFASGLLPTRTPDEVYRQVVLQRLPASVTEDRIGAFPYMVAAAPVRTGGLERLVTVPLADRQREIEREIDELDRGVHLAALFFILAGAGIGLSMAERIADPVRRLTLATRRIARGDFDAHIAVRSADELQRLVDAFNSMAAELKAQRGQLERTHRLEAWAEMARQVAHEIKNPLTPIQLSAEHLQRVHADRGEPMGPVLESCVSSILTQVRLLRQISAEFSSFASSPTARPAPVDLVDVVAEVVDPYRTGLAGRIEIVNRVAAPLPQVFVDRTLLARALVNVVENALHAMPGAGSLTIDAAPDGGMVAVSVQDTGAGMDEDALARAFEPYFSTKTTGTGLGLPIAKRNIELNGGTVEVHSRRGEGTVVRLRLPRVEREGVKGKG